MPQEIRINLEVPSDLVFHLPNELDKSGRPVPHRKTAIGTDRKGKARLMSVIGLMPTVVHGTDSAGDPHTLIVFEWSAVPEALGLRFRHVTIEVSFAAHGTRRNAEDEAAELRQRGFNFNYWDPEVVALAPSGVEWYNRSMHRIGGKSTLELGFSAGFAPYFSFAPKYCMERDSSASGTDAVQVKGTPFVVGTGRNRPNAIRWTMMENSSRRSGVPAYLRTAVLLKRQPDDNGIFLGSVSVETEVSWLEDLKEKVRKLNGNVPKDEAIVFDPDVPGDKSSLDRWKDKLDSVKLHDECRVVMLEPPDQNDGAGEGDPGGDAAGDAKVNVSVEVSGDGGGQESSETPA